MIVIIQQTAVAFKLEMTKEKLTTFGGLALMVKFKHGIESTGLTDQYIPVPGSNQGFDPPLVVNGILLMLQGVGKNLGDLRE